MIYALIFAASVVLFFVLVDFGRFAVKSRLTTDAGGTLMVSGGKTYYIMPKGTRRKIADYPMDLTPGSQDMTMLATIMESAKKAHEDDKSIKRKKAITAMKAVADEI